LRGLQGERLAVRGTGREVRDGPAAARSAVSGAREERGPAGGGNGRPPDVHRVGPGRAAPRHFDGDDAAGGARGPGEPAADHSAGGAERGGAGAVGGADGRPPRGATGGGGGDTGPPPGGTPGQWASG